MEAHGDEGDICGGQLHPETAQVRAVYPAHGTPLQESPRHTSGAQGRKDRQNKKELSYFLILCYFNLYCFRLPFAFPSSV
jgi:hypothetical protein